MNDTLGSASAGPLEVVLVNGVPWPAVPAAESVSPFDRGLHFGDGLFETIACRRGRPRFLSWHLERLALGCERLRIAAPKLDAVRDEIRSLASGVDSALLKVILTRGPATERGYAPTGRENSTRITFRYGWPAENPTWSLDGVAVRTAALRLGENPALAGLKHLNRLEQVMARAESDARFAESLLFSSSGRLISGTMTNVFIVRKSQIYTPRVDLCGVAGVMRRWVLNETAQTGQGAEEAVLRAGDLEHAEELFLTNARIGIWPVREIDGRRLEPGPVTRGLQQRLAPILEDPDDA